jgi:AcrR family transcriptional regulator
MMQDEPMARKPDPHRRSELLERVIEYLCENGIGELSLRPLAARLGVSTYALAYHFGSREGVLEAALHAVEARQRAMVLDWAREHPGQTTADLLRRYWNWCCEPPNLAVMRLTIEATVLDATRSGVPVALRVQLVTEWVNLLAAALRRAGRSPASARTEATLLNAALVGLVLDLVATGDRRRTGRALDRLVAGL